MLSMLRLDGVLKTLFPYEENTFERPINYRFTKKRCQQQATKTVLFNQRQKGHQLEK
jgi:hypothetical protein